MVTRKVRIAAVAVGIAVWGVAAVNYLNLQEPAASVLKEDPRNEGIQVFAHYKYFVNPDVLVYDLRRVSSTSSPMDVARVLLQFAAKQKDRSFEFVELSHKGSEKFKMKGEYF